MWTPRRVVLLLAGLALFGGSYLTYSRALGWLDGLPQLPDKFRDSTGGEFRPPERATSPTVEKLREAFGPDCPELSDQNYPTKLEFRNGDSSVVLAAGATPLVPNSHRVTLSPFSVAMFGKPKPAHLRAPGEVAEISTFHADKAVLEFDRAIDNPNDMNRARLVKLELVSEPELALPDPRRGRVHITNNQRSADRNRFLVLRTPGPVFYREPKNNPDAGTGPDVWTDAEVEVIDRANLPRGFGTAAPPTAPARGADLRDAAAVPAILAGQRLPPPTVTAIGMKIFFEPDPKTPGAKPAAKKEGGSFGGLRRIELREKVLVNLWVDSNQSLVGGTGDAPWPAQNLAAAEAPRALAAAFGGPALATPPARQFEKALLQVETLGPFAYDVEKNLARFDALPQANPNLPNDVQVTRILPHGGGRQLLFTQVLELEFLGAPAGDAKAAAPPGPTPPKNGDGGSSFRTVHAYTYTPGRYLTATSEDERLEAYGQDLLFDQPAGRTTLIGAPLYVVLSNEPRAKVEKAGGSVLTAGTRLKQALLTIEPGPPPEKRATLRVDGPGTFELVEAGAGGSWITATWQTSMAQVREYIGGRELDRLTFTDGAKFEDPKADYWLKGRELKLWLERASAAGAAGAGGKPLPNRLQATGDVTSHAADFDVEQAEFLTVVFRDGLPPPPRPAAGPPVPPPTDTASAIPPPTGLVPPGTAGAPKEKPKPPLKLRARVVDSWVVRYPTGGAPKVDARRFDPTAAAAPEPKPEEAPALKYELEKARCEGHVIVHQDPDDPEKPRGLDVLGNVLLVDKTPQGSVLTVTGTEKELGQVHHEGMSILGPKVVVDQLHNVCTVDGRGALSMPAGTDLGGNDLKQPETLAVFWRDSMTFSGSTKTAEFVGKVRAAQGESWVVCHTLQVTLDREIYFNQLGRPERPPAPAPQPGAAAAKAPKEKDGPKVDRVFCYPAPDDARDEDRKATEVTFNQVERDEAGNVVKTQQLTAREIAVFAQAQDDPRAEKYQKVEATGPGVVRIWQPGQRDLTGPDAAPPAGAAAKPAETEMKLTIVSFAGRMTTKDKGKVYQEATFRMAVEVYSVPAESPNVVVEKHRLPPRSTVLTCTDQVVVSTHKRKDGPPAQRMDATGNAFIRSDEYDGWGEAITYDGQFVVLEGKGPSLARITSRFQNSETPGRRIVYDRVRNRYEVDGTPGGTIQPGPGTPKK